VEGKLHLPEPLSPEGKNLSRKKLVKDDDEMMAMAAFVALNCYCQGQAK
jgi:hypothetical protein